MPMISSSSKNVVVLEDKYDGVERALSICMQIMLNLDTHLLILGGFVRIMSKLKLSVGIRGGVSWDRRNIEYKCHKMLCMCEIL